MKSLLFFMSEPFLLNRKILWLLVWINGLGTIYGYYWYANQIEYTLQQMASGLVLFVPDSPTASLFFTLALLFLLFARHRPQPGRVSGLLRGVVEAMACVTSLKYGIWAVVMIFAGAARGDELGWQDWMLVVSHTGMALEAILYARFFTYGRLALLIVALWTVSNDIIDYTFHVFPWLPAELHGDISLIRTFTLFMSFLSVVWMERVLKFRTHNRINSSV